MGDDEVRVDLHVHSCHSDKTYSWLMQAAHAAECYTPPHKVYELATARGMNLVTISDHDEIAGALELCAIAPNTFISEEISARFPEDGCVVHTIALDITEAQHAEIQRLRRNIYELSAFLHGEQIEHFLCHPLAPVNRRLDASHIKRCLLMFRNIEVRNGTRDAALELEMRRILHILTPKRLEKWADEFRQTPFINRDGRYGFVGGSDDHAALSIARAYTTFTGEASGKGLVQALRERRTGPGGHTARPEVLSHNIYGVIASHLSHVGQLTGGSRTDAPAKTDERDHGHDDGTVGGEIARDISGEIHIGGASPGRSGPSGLAAALGRWGELAGQSTQGLDFGLLAREGHTNATQSKLGDILETVLVGSSRDAWGGLRGAILGALPIEAADEVAEILKSLLLAAPALLAGRAYAHDRAQARSIGHRLAGPDAAEPALRVAIVTDTVDETNGVALGLRRLVTNAGACGLDARLVGLGDGDRVTTDAEGIVRIPAVLRHRLKDYPQIDFGVPHLPSLLDYIVRHDIDLVQCSTPGPVGLGALAAARLAGVPVIGQYHTDMPEYVARITGDTVLADLFGRFVGWFYGQMDRVLAPSTSARDRLASLGVPAHKLHLVPRGIDLDLFSPTRKDDRLFARFGVADEPKILYVGRLSREKGLDPLIEAFTDLLPDFPKAKLVLVGDGPYAQALAAKVPVDRVIFAGERKGEELASFYASSDIFVLPSETETFGNVVVEAQAAGLPVIVANRGAAKENVLDGVTGLVVDARTPAQLGGALRQLLTQPELRLEMARAAAQFARRFDLRSAAAGTLAIYRSFLEQGDVRPPKRRPSVVISLG